ncbi:MAG: flavin-containing monooxygenase, partial [Gammaproteobacteria bacterium]
KIETIGRNGRRLQDKWANGPHAFLGMTIAGFPNLFMIFGPFGPFTSQPLVHEYQVNWMTNLIAEADRRNCLTIDTDPSAEDAWVELCREGMSQTLFPQVASWINGANVPGKPRAAMFYMGGMVGYMAELDAIVESGYPCFRFS